MRIIKSFVTAVVFLLAFESLISAEMTVMSLQERIRQSDLVVVGEILEAHNTGKETETGTEHWLATCRVERCITNKTHDPDAEVLKRVNTIRIRFVQIPQQKPAPLELSEGKKYLLFLRDRGSQYQGEVAYEMITLYHGAFEAGQDYFVHDEQSPEYPQAVKMSFDEIVQRVTQKNPASVDIREQPERELSEDELRMKERLIALSRGEGDVADLRVEVMDGNPMTLTGMRIYNIADGKVVSQEWASIGSPEKRGERAVTDEEIRRLLQTLIEHQYWTFQGTQFIPDAPGFMVRFHYKDLSPVEYRCDAHEYEPSAQLSAIRSLWLDFVSSVSTTLKVEKPKG